MIRTASVILLLLASLSTNIIMFFGNKEMNKLRIHRENGQNGREMEEVKKTIKEVKKTLETITTALIKSKPNQMSKPKQNEICDKSSKIMGDALSEFYASGIVTPSSVSQRINMPLPNPIFNLDSNIGASLKKCFESTKISEIPEFEKFSSAKCGMHLVSFHPLRREGNLGKILYCFGKEKKLQTFVDIFTSWGGGTLLLAGGISNSGLKVPEKSLTGWEIDKARWNGADSTIKLYLESLASNSRPKIDVRFGSTMDESSISGSIDHVQGGTGDLPQFCKHQSTVDFMLSDSGAGTTWKLNDGTKINTQELYFARDVCKPKYLCLLNIFVNKNVIHPDKHYFYESTRKSSNWQVVVEGSSAGVGCLNTMFDDRYFACFERK